MTRLSAKLSFRKSYRWKILSLCALTLFEALIARRLANAQAAPPSNAFSHAIASTDPSIQSYIDFLQAMQLASDGSKPEALRRLAQSFRLQPQGNVAAGLTFELLAEQRTNSALVLRGHTDAVISAVYSPDGKKIATTSTDHTARLWDAQTGKEVGGPLLHKDQVLAANFSPDGEYLVTGSTDETARIWNVVTGKPVGVPMRLTGSVETVAFSPDGKIVATGTDGAMARFWDAATGQPLSPPIVYHEPVYSITFSPDGTRAAVATGDGVADLLDPKNGQRLAKPLRQGNTVFDAVFSPDGRVVLTGSADHTAKTWDAITGQALNQVFHQGAPIDFVAYSPDGSRIVTTSWDHTARVWDVRSGQPIAPPLQHADVVYKAIFNPDASIVVTLSRDLTAKIWDASTGELVRLAVRQKSGVTTIALSPSGSSLLAGFRDGTAQVFDIPPQAPAPAWLADLAEFAATQNKYDQSRLPDLVKIRALRTQLLASTSDDPWSVFGRWYFAESDVRPISPWSKIPLEQYVDTLIAAGDKDSLDYAATLSNGHPAWMQKIIPLRAKLTTATSDKPRGSE